MQRFCLYLPVIIALAFELTCCFSKAHHTNNTTHFLYTLAVYCGYLFHKRCSYCRTKTGEHAKDVSEIGLLKTQSLSDEAAWDATSMALVRHQWACLNQTHVTATLGTFATPGSPQYSWL